MNYVAKKRTKDILALVLLWTIVAIVIFPLVYMVILAGSDSNSIAIGEELTSVRLKNFGINFIQMQKNINFSKFFMNSVIVVGTTTLISLMLSTFAGYALARFKFPGANLFGLTMLGTQLIPPVLLLIPTYMIFVFIQRKFGFTFVDTYKGLIIPYVAIFTPMSIWIIRGFFTRIPRELEEAARIDGCSQFQAFYKIILPISLPGIIATGIFIFLAAWDELMIASVLTTSTKVQTVPIGIRLFIGNVQNRFDLTMMAAVIASLPVALVFFGLQKYFIQGMTAGAVKG